MNSLELLKKSNVITWWYAFIVCIIASFIQGITFDFILNPHIQNKLIANLTSYIASLIFIILFVRYLENNSLKTLGFKDSKIVKSVISGFNLALLSLIVIIGILFLLTNISFNILKDNNYKIVVVLIFLFGIQGFTEELIFRGYLMNRIAASKGKWWGVYINSLFFLIFHIKNPSVSYISSVNIYIFGVVLSLIFWYTDNIWIVGALHGAWNVILGVFMGGYVSGIKIPNTIFYLTFDSENILLTGGSFGIEGSIISTIYFIIIGILLYVGLYLEMFRKINNNK
jgi:CAAX amino terminal protease family protein